MAREGEGCVLYGEGCPEHGMTYLYRKYIDGLWYELCSEQNCNYKEVVLKERRQNQPIQFMDRRKNGT